MDPEFGASFLLVCAVYDQKVGAFLQPFFVKTRGEASRSFSDAVNNPEHGFHRHPEDFSLHLLGQYYEEKGRFANMDPVPELLVLAKAVLSA